MHCAPHIAVAMFSRLAGLLVEPDPHGPLPSLSSRESQILALVEQGRSNTTPGSWTFFGFNIGACNAAATAVGDGVFSRPFVNGVGLLPGVVGSPFAPEKLSSISTISRCRRDRYEAECCGSLHAAH